MVVACVALIAALGGTGYAASQAKPAKPPNHGDKAQDVALIKEQARPKAYAGKVDSKPLPGTIPSDTLVVKLPAGSYLAYAKVNIGRTSGTGMANGLCFLTAYTGGTAAADADFTAVDNVGANAGLDRAALSLQLRAKIGPGGGSVRVRCSEGPNGLDPVQLTATDVRLSAVAVQP
jgi:hypothetical protein